MQRRWQRQLMGRDQIRGVGALGNRLRRLTCFDRLDEAHAFLELFAQASNQSRAAFRRRWAQASGHILRFGWYEHTGEELAFGAKLAWRNHARCLGRLYWDNLIVRDRRNVSTPEGIFADLCDHLALAQGDGRVRSVISIYPSARDNEPSSYVESPQVIQYAGYLGSDGQVTGDRRSVEFTRVVKALGWHGPHDPGPFDILPVLMRDGAGHRRLFNLPDGLVREVAIRHPEFPDLNDLGLRWYAIPLISDMILSIGGIEYPCAPFNGFYMCTEIASRNLADRTRYNLLPDVARCFGQSSYVSDVFWRDKALTELNRAMLESFEAAGVTMLDHHTATDQFMQFLSREGSAGRPVSADWAWIVPPQASASCEVFHLETTDLRTVPNFYRNRSTDGSDLRPFRGHQPRSSLRRFFERARRQMSHAGR
ncbi:nitric oxide synthase oxygenase [Seohaeicola nanhaiensis]|uniref:Nitric oxide synthase oxygenase n=1 Tax=Seohaeicola nanhaiensis TaxID=1387282 RepID=A0ABV9KNK1_9RHOB